MTAARYGLLFGCDPMAVLDLDPGDLDIAQAVYLAGARDAGQYRRT